MIGWSFAVCFVYIFSWAQGTYRSAYKFDAGQGLLASYNTRRVATELSGAGALRRSLLKGADQSSD